MNIVSQVASKLKSHGIESSRVNAEIMLSSILGLRRADLYIKDIRLDCNQLKQLDEMVKQRVSGEPLQYIIGKVNFYGNEFLIEPGVFIPRSETEILVDAVLNLITSDERQRAAAHCRSRRIRSDDRAYARERQAREMVSGQISADKLRALTEKVRRKATSDERRIFDLGTGSGNIAISLTKAFEHCKVIGSDISEKAIALAKRNACLHGVSERIEFIKADLFGIPERYKGSFDIIVSNPPYIAHEELENLTDDVKKEPAQALDGGRYGINFYSRIIKESHLFLKRDGIIILELADGISKKVEELFKSSGSFNNIRVFNDLNNIERVMAAKCRMKRLLR